MLLEIGREVTTNIQGAREFTISKNSTKIFAMLSNMLYKDKERSVLTELSSNALDAHKMIGRPDLPIKVTMPTQLCPEVRIRDFGPGMSEEQVIQFLTTYGESSKQDSNDFIGGFGIGSKSPAAVTDTWNVISHHNGECKQYIVFITSEGVPSLTLMHTKPTTETGLEVVVPAKKERIRAWNDAAQKAYIAYPVMPQIHNANFSLKPLKCILDIPSFATTDNYEISYMGASALINNRLYPLDSSQIDGLTPFQRSVFQIGGILRFETGELNLNLSREDLQYDNKTIRAIKEKIEKAANELREIWKVEVIAKSTNELEYFTYACQTMEKWFEKCNSYNSFAEEIYRTMSLGCVHYSNKLSFRNKRIEFKMDSTQYSFKTLYAGTNKVVSSTTKHGSFWHRQFDHNTNVASMNLHIPSLEKTVFVEDDASYVNLRVRESYGDKNTNVIIGTSFKWLPPFLQHRVTKASALPKPEIKRAARGEKVKSTYYLMVNNHFEAREETHFTDTLKDETIAYVTFSKATSASSIGADFAPYIENLKYFDIVVVGIKEGVTPPTWAKTPKEALEAEFAKINVNFDHAHAVQFYHENRNFFEHYENGYDVTKVKGTQQASVWNTFLDAMKQGRALKSTINTEESKRILYNANKLATILGKKLPDNKFEPVRPMLEATYPMLSLLMGRNMSLTTGQQAGIVLDYVNMVGK